MDKPVIMTVFGTRPEAVKVAPLIKAIEADPDLASCTVVTAQHRGMLDQINGLFGIEPDYDLDVFEPGQHLNVLFSKVIKRLDPVLEEVAPDAVVVQGDTSTVAAAALAAFYRGIPVVHVEAGLRSHDLFSPFPEEANRRLATQVTSLHLAPTSQARANLQAENIDPETIVVTGNTVIDALHHVVGTPHSIAHAELAELVNSKRPTILVSAHRRENWGEPMARIARAIRELSEEFPEHAIVMPMHKNPKVRSDIEPVLGGLPNVILTEPLDYRDFVQMLDAAVLVITDSGGVQEEAPALGKPVLVLRETTERPEAVDAGTVTLIGTEQDRIVAEASLLLTDDEAYQRMARAVSPYGDGRAAERSLAAIKQLIGVGERVEDFSLVE